MRDLLTQGPGLALEILLELNKLIDGENSENQEQMDVKGEKASKALLEMLDTRSKEEVLALFASMNTVQNVSGFLFDDMLGYVEGKWGPIELIDASRN